MARVKPKSKATGTNPKDLFGSVKVSFSKIPAFALAHEAMAMGDGADRYGPYNWRDKPVIASIYVDANFRHVLDWWEGQTFAKDSKTHHLGHARACLGILLDAEAHGALVDDRPFTDPEAFDRLLDQLSETIKERKAERAAAKKKGKRK